MQMYFDTVRIRTYGTDDFISKKNKEIKLSNEHMKINSNMSFGIHQIINTIIWNLQIKMSTKSTLDINIRVTISNIEFGIFIKRRNKI